MAWNDYYRLMDKYDGDLDKATADEMYRAKLNDSPDSRTIAGIVFARDRRKKGKGKKFIEKPE